MTTIGLVADDQSLEVAVNPVITSGEENTVILHVDFSEDWNGFGKAAVFFTEKNKNTLYEKIMSGGECIVPSEVMVNEGTFLVGIRGVNSTSKQVKTTSLVKYKISKGTPAVAEFGPTPDVYEQLLSAYEKADSSIVKLNSDIEFERARIDNLSTLKEGSTTADAELIDIRVKADGSTATSAGNAVREQITELKGDLEEYYFETINEPLFTKKDTLVNGYVNRINGIMHSEDTTSKSVYQAKLKSGKTKITFGYGRCFAFYDENKTYITNEGILNESGSVTIDIPTNAVYISYSWKIEQQEKFVAVYGETTEPLYKIGVPTTLEKRVYNLENRDELITADKVSFLSVGENLFNKSTETQDSFLNEGEIVLNNSDYVGYCVSDYVKVKANTNYISNKNITRYCLYDKDKKYVTQNSSNQAVITPTVDGYIRLAYYSPTSDKHNSNELMFIIGDTVPTEYKAYCFYPNSTDEYPLDFNKTWWKDKLICTFGDSNTANQRWQQYMNAQLGCTHQNCGIAGTSMCGDSENAMWQDARINTIDDNAKAILIMAGTNDGAGSREIGTMSTDNEDANTFVGAYNTCIRKIYTKMGITFPIFLFTPIPCFDNTTYPRVKEMAHAIKEIGAMWSLPVIDAQNECGINVANWESLYASDGVHVDYEGGKMLASLVVGILKAHEPID